MRDNCCQFNRFWLSARRVRIDRLFLRDAFGPTAEHFRSRLLSDEVMAELEVALWELLAPIAKQSGPFGSAPHMGTNEGKRVWNCLLESSCDVARRCFDAGRADVENFRAYREYKEKVMQEFSSLCIDAFQDIFVMPLMQSFEPPPQQCLRRALRTIRQSAVMAASLGW